MTKKKKNRALSQTLQKGQIWELKDSQLQIVLIGKTLVHYKLFKGQTRGVRVSLSSKESLETLLISQKANLVRE